MKSSHSRVTINNNTFSSASEFSDVQDEITAIKNHHQRDQKDIVEKLKCIDERLSCLEIRTTSRKNDLNIEKSFKEFQESTKEKIKKFDDIYTLLNKNSHGEHTNTKSINESLTKLNSEKVDRSELQDLLCKKADYDVVRKKVTTEVFEETKRELLGKLMVVMTTMNKRDVELKKEFSELREMKETKAGKDEIVMINEEMNKKVNGIYNRMISLNSLKRENLAAGTKYRILKGVKCISCDGDVTMKIVQDFTDPLIGKLAPRKSSSRQKVVRAQTSSHPQVTQKFKIPINATESYPSTSTKE